MLIALLPFGRKKKPLKHFNGSKNFSKPAGISNIEMGFGAHSEPHFMAKTP